MDRQKHFYHTFQFLKQRPSMKHRTISTTAVVRVTNTTTIVIKMMFVKIHRRFQIDNAFFSSRILQNSFGPNPHPLTGPTVFWATRLIHSTFGVFFIYYDIQTNVYCTVSSDVQAKENSRRHYADIVFPDCIADRSSKIILSSKQ